MGRLIHFPDDKVTFYELRAEFAEAFRRLHAAETFDEKQDETNKLQLIVQKVQLILLKEKLCSRSGNGAHASESTETIA